ncbi:patatin-like phospholipase family protein [Dokdonella sp.]|uniref:patatin-like phospholipase family protein n=1 Tax=Dokdonella sp. TaxID=2291710 RepID=UPI003C457AFD
MATSHDSIAGLTALALQGGGAHGAFTWGVLDRLLEESTFELEQVSGTSSGALNALALAQGWMDGGRDGARECLSDLWRRVASHTHAASWIFGSQARAGKQATQNLHRYFTPRQINPLGFNPVRQIAESLFDFDRLRENLPFPLHLAATRVRDGALVMFGPEELGIEALMASTCLPQLFEPVTIHGEVYWDGGWAGNPALEPLVHSGRTPRILVILVQPLDRAEIPATPAKIAERISELGFSSAFLRELRTLALAQGALEGAITLSWLGQRVKDLQIHIVEPGESLDAFRSGTGFNDSTSFLTALRDHGRRRAESWIADPRAHMVSGNFPLLNSGST